MRTLPRTPMLLAVAFALANVGCGVSGAVRAISSASRASRAASTASRAARAARGAKTASSAAKTGGVLRAGGSGALLGEADELTRVPLALRESDELARVGGLSKLDDESKLGDLVEVSLDAYDIVISSDDEPVEAPQSVLVGRAHPRFVALDEELEAVTELLEGAEDDRSPWVIVGRSKGATAFEFELEGEALPATRVAAGCWTAGVTCVFVACDAAACVSGSRAVFDILVQLSEDEGLSVPAFVETYVRMRNGAHEDWPAPPWLGVGGGLAGAELRYLELSDEAHDEP